MKMCTKCNESKELTKFGKSASNKDGFVSYCRAVSV